MGNPFALNLECTRAAPYCPGQSGTARSHGAAAHRQRFPREAGLCANTQPTPYNRGVHNLLFLEIFFLGLLGLAVLAIGWVSGVVLLNLFRGQR